MRKTILSLVLAMTMMSTLPAFPQGQWGNSFTSDDARKARENQGLKSTSELRKQLERDMRAEYVEVFGPFTRSNRTVYRFHLKTRDGENIYVTVDAKDGTVQSVRSN